MCLCLFQRPRRRWRANEPVCNEAITSRLQHAISINYTLEFKSTISVLNLNYYAYLRR